MPSLETNVEELLKLFPREMNNLRVVSPINMEKELKIVYFQSDTDDPLRNWEALDNWIGKVFEGGKFIPLPDDVAEIYHSNFSPIDEELISPEDKLLLRVNLSQPKYFGELRESVVNLDWINRHPDPELRGIGEEFYQNLLGFLKDKGYRFIMATSVSEELENYWVKLGQVPVDYLKPEKAAQLGVHDPMLPLHVHFLYAADKPVFMKPV